MTEVVWCTHRGAQDGELSLQGGNGSVLALELRLKAEEQFASGARDCSPGRGAVCAKAREVDVFVKCGDLVWLGPSVLGVGGSGEEAVEVVGMVSPLRKSCDFTLKAWRASERSLGR